MASLDTLIWSVIVVGISNQLTPLFNRAIGLFLFLFATKRTVDSTTQLHILNRELVTNGYCSNLANGDPGVGMHVLFYRDGFLLCFKSRRDSDFQQYTTFSYDVYVIGTRAVVKRYDKFIENTTDNDIQVCYCTQSALYRSNFAKMREIPLSVPHEWQLPIIDKLVKDFRQQKRASCIISGKMGIGKTSIGSIFSGTIQKLGLATKPCVYFMDPTAKGFDIFTFLSPNASDVCILMFDEYDTIVAHAEGEKDGESEGQSMAKSRSSWLGTMDRFAKTRYIVVIATTNVPLDSIDERYIRDGRIDNKFTV